METAAATTLERGVEQFNRREFFECHETLEALWLAEPGHLRRLYQGVLQVGVGFHHLLRGNYRGAVILLERGVSLLEPFEPVSLRMDVSGLVQQARRCRRTLLQLGPDRMGDFDRDLIPTITVGARKEGCSTVGR